ncbi:hypothetical protein FRB90_006679, partial [Tulasnella sp. 427]
DDDDDEDDEPAGGGGGGRRHPRPTLPFMLTRSVIPADFGGEPFRLYCGGALKRSRATSLRRKRDDAVWPSPFPSLSGEPSKRRASVPASSTGCGELVCLRACASERIGVWLSDASKLPKNVTRMEEQYVDHGPGNVIKTGRSNCGCEHEGIGCRNWSVLSPLFYALELITFGCLISGNSLGMKIHHCQRHSELHASLAQSWSRTSPPTKRRMVYVFNPTTVTHDPDFPAPFPFDLPEEPRPHSDLMSLPQDLLRMAPEEVSTNFYRLPDDRFGDNNSTPTTPTPPITIRRPRAPIPDRLPGLIPAILDDEQQLPRVQVVTAARPGWSIIRSPSSPSPPSPALEPPTRIVTAVRSMPSLTVAGPSTSTEERRRSRNFGAWGPPGLEETPSARVGSGLLSQCPTPPTQATPDPLNQGEAAASSSRHLNSQIPSQSSSTIPLPSTSGSLTPAEDGNIGVVSASEPPAVLSQPVVDAIARLEAIRSRLNAILNDS